MKDATGVKCFVTLMQLLLETGIMQISSFFTNCFITSLIITTSLNFKDYPKQLLVTATKGLL